MIHRSRTRVSFIAVNVEGVYRTTKAFAPLVIESKGRIVTTGSIAGTISWPGGSAYSGSKHWMEAFTDALAGEMEESGVVGQRRRARQLQVENPA